MEPLQTCGSFSNTDGQYAHSRGGGADVKALSADGSTPLIAACSRGLGKIAQLLMQNLG